MRLRYETEYSNQLHQLLVSVSRHLYVARNGLVKYQDKPFEVNITNYHKSKKEHLVYYIMRDHFSGTFGFEIATTSSLIPLADFLYSSWSEGEAEKYLWGMPEQLFVPQRISSAELFDGLKKLGIEPRNPPSGFASGVRIVRDLEQHILWMLNKIAVHHPDNIRKYKDIICKYMISPAYDDSKFQKWRDNLPAEHPGKVPPYDEFVKCFTVAHQAGPGLILVNSSADETGGLKQWASLNHPVDLFPIEGRKFSAAKLKKAQELINEAWEVESREKSIDLAWRALKMSPYCADAYVLLAGESETTQEKLELYEKGVLAGRLALGDLFFKRHAGDFWGIWETTPFMRALAGLADSLWETGRRQEAIKHYMEMLRLNHDDNQGIRYILASCLLEEGMDEEAGRLLAEYEGDISCSIAFSRALWTYRVTGGSNKESDSCLADAIRSNMHVPAYLLGEKHIPFRLPGYYSFGDENEAIIYAGKAQKAWQNTPGALDWLAGIFRKVNT